MTKAKKKKIRSHWLGREVVEAADFFGLFVCLLTLSWQDVLRRND